MTPGARRIPDALLERYLSDSLQGETRARIETLLASSPADQAHLEALRADSAAFLLKHPPGPLVARFQERPLKTWWGRWRGMLNPVLVAATLVLILHPSNHPNAITVADEDSPYTTKGAAIVVLHRKTQAGSAQVSPDVPLAPGDSIRLEVRAPLSGFIAVLGRDSRGAITIYHPYEGTAAAPHDVDKPVLPGAFTLDDAPGREDVYVLHSKSPFELTWAVQALQAGRVLAKVAPPGISVGHTYFTKQAAP